MSDNVEVRCLGKSAMSSDQEAFNAGLRCQENVRQLSAKIESHGKNEIESKMLTSVFGSLLLDFDRNNAVVKPTDAKGFNDQVGKFQKFISDSAQFGFLNDAETGVNRAAKGDRLEVGRNTDTVAKKGDRLKPETEPGSKRHGGETKPSVEHPHSKKASRVK